ncbi:MAG: hypothetical protein ACRDTC_14680 [Pseudonocardiaceae bacterium]
MSKTDPLMSQQVARAERPISSAIRMAHLAGLLEALLWWPDLVVGAVGAARHVTAATWTNSVPSS